ncbi:hypothetical protein A500_00920 [Clostridium sartagoforme AAU1]|uniref:Uncharacterized protein n=1 Tax=Clostridium sartagoforme AAU1 TaxID=1202534 RepID=R9CFG6_9CLOT|nr:hypothetical protein [Clostridium sartagoforme]EOR28094.1 hypothetical protein A500_00920 [Clostridium sartagoforme AAU1]
MKARRKKKGSTFVIVIVVMAIIFTTGTTILAVTANDYKMRINQSKKLQNLYEADSGLDVVENIIIKTSQEAIKYADKEVKKEFTKLEDKDRSKENLNKVFKERFYKYLSAPQNIKDLDGTVKTVDKILEYLILSKAVIGSIQDNDTINLAKLENIKSFNIEILKSDYDRDSNNIILGVKSTFQNIEGQLKNEKVISTEYIVSAPEYNSEITSINISPVFDGKAITADGNMNVTGGNTNISGDIWIQGNNNLGENPEYAFDKYIGGIKLDNTSFNINGDIYTANTYHLNNNAQSTITGDVFAKNIYVGKSINSDASKSNNVTFENNVIVNNDLALNAQNSNVLIKNNFYGINEKTTEIETAKQALNSSSIIVNSLNSNSTLKVEGLSYIMGVAYLNTIGDDGKKYQTGESVAVKGNYLAYTDVDDILDGKTNVTLRYYSPLQLLESKDGESNASKKAEYFAEYYNDSKTEGKYSFNDGGVQLKGEVKSAGATIKNNKVQGATIFSVDDKKEIINTRNEFARNVFAMGDDTGYENLYDGQEVERTVRNQIAFDKIKDTNIINENGAVILTNNSSIEIKENKYNGQIIKKGLIITNGDITIDGEFNFMGNIITTGDIILKGEGNKTITYDPQVVRSILALNNELLKDVFVKSKANREEIKVTSASEIYSVDKFLKKSLWKILK